MSRTDGRKLVAVAGTAIVGALGFATIYLPFVADRGMHVDTHSNSFLLRTFLH
jgi:hypothetical protein